MAGTSPNKSGHDDEGGRLVKAIVIVDLTLVDLRADNSAVVDPTRTYADRTARGSARTPEGSGDMGTGYDCSDVKGHTAARSISSVQRQWRRRAAWSLQRARFVDLFYA